MAELNNNLTFFILIYTDDKISLITKLSIFRLKIILLTKSDTSENE